MNHLDGVPVDSVSGISHTPTQALSKVIDTVTGPLKGKKNYNSVEKTMTHAWSRYKCICNKRGRHSETGRQGKNYSRTLVPFAKEDGTRGP